MFPLLFDFCFAFINLLRSAILVEVLSFIWVFRWIYFFSGVESLAWYKIEINGESSSYLPIGNWILEFGFLLDMGWYRGIGWGCVRVSELLLGLNSFVSIIW